MKVAELMRVLEGIAIGLSGVAGQASKEMAAFHAGMQPFAEQNVGEFLAFLAKCDEYKRTGVIAPGKRSPTPKKPAATLSVADAIGSVRGILDQINLGTVSGQLIDETVGRFKKMSRPQLDDVLKGLQIQGKAKNKDDAVGKIKQVLDTQFEMYLRTHPGAQSRPLAAPPPTDGA